MKTATDCVNFSAEKPLLVRRTHPLTESEVKRLKKALKDTTARFIIMSKDIDIYYVNVPLDREAKPK